jgi:hypothetical protein
MRSDHISSIADSRHTDTDTAITTASDIASASDSAGDWDGDETGATKARVDHSGHGKEGNPMHNHNHNSLNIRLFGSVALLLCDHNSDLDMSVTARTGTNASTSSSTSSTDSTSSSSSTSSSTDRANRPTLSLETSTFFDMVTYILTYPLTLCDMHIILTNEPSVPPFSCTSQ